MKISGFSFALISLSLSVLPARAQQDTLVAGRVRGIQFADVAQTLASLQKKEIPLLKGFSVSADLFNAVLYAADGYGQLEGAVRLNLKNTFFPAFETGWGICNHTNEDTEIHYQTRAPFFRIGVDYNLLRDKHSANRLFAGLRYGFTTFAYDVSAPPLRDPVWGSETPFYYRDVRSNQQWAEVVFGLETPLWKFVHLGWTLRKKYRIGSKASPIGNAWYVPGYGKQSASVWGGSFSLFFDI